MGTYEVLEIVHGGLIVVGTASVWSYRPRSKLVCIVGAAAILLGACDMSQQIAELKQRITDLEDRSLEPPPPVVMPPAKWVPDHTIEIALLKNPDRPWCLWCDAETDYAGPPVTDGMWLAIVDYAQEVFERSRIRVQILTEKTSGVVDAEVTFWKGWPGGSAPIAGAWRRFDPGRQEVLCPAPCTIDFYMGYWYADSFWESWAGLVLAHEIVHIVGRLFPEGQCAHPPSFHDEIHRGAGHRLYIEDRLTDHVRQNCFEGLPPWVIPEQYW